MQQILAANLFTNQKFKKMWCWTHNEYTVPKEGGDGMTISPGDSPLTAEPTECTSPTPSYPPTAGTCGLTGYTPFMVQFKNPQLVSNKC